MDSEGFSPLLSVQLGCIHDSNSVAFDSNPDYLIGGIVKLTLIFSYVGRGADWRQPWVSDISYIMGGKHPLMYYTWIDVSYIDQIQGSYLLIYWGIHWSMYHTRISVWYVNRTQGSYLLMGTHVKLSLSDPSRVTHNVPLPSFYGNKVSFFVLQQQQPPTGYNCVYD